MNPIIKIDLNKFKEVSWPIVIIFMAKYFGWLTTQRASLVYIALLVVMLGFAKRIIIPKVKGLYPYLFFIIYSTSMGFMQYEARDVVRDLYYILPTIIMIILGYYFKMVHKDNVSIMKTIVLCGTILATYRFVLLFSDMSILSDASELRDNFDVGSYEVMIAFLLVFCVVFTNFKLKLFNKWVNYYCFIVMFLQLLLSLARSVWIELLVGCITIFFLDAYVNRKIVNSTKNLVTVAFIAVIGVSFFFNVAPQTATDTFMEKFSNTSDELNSEQEFSSTRSAMKNWRGYENQCAIDQWKKNSALESIIGEGLGKGIYLKYVPYTWKEMVSQNEIPILHSGYHTLLPKGGIVGVFTLVWFMLANILLGLKLIKKRTDIQTELMVLIVSEVIFMIQTYVVRGPVAQNVNIIWSILVGWISATINRIKLGKNNI